MNRATRGKRIIFSVFGWVVLIAGSRAQVPVPAVQVDPTILAKAQAGDAAAAISIGEAYASAPGRSQDCKQAATWFEKAGGIPGAMHLATLYRDGCKALPRDMTTAAKWYEKAADLGDATAQGTLGTLYFFGQGVTQNYNEAYFWLDLAARQAGPKQQQYAQNRQLAGAHITADEVEAAKERVENWLYAHKKPN
jgi:TPR repeat protein